ncbi:MAG: hypothetical protein JO131_08820, partial [Gammaproteobacteria bacterium]|nr:hypothetical protein [Gammaproteobacteria bacterium]
EKNIDTFLDILLEINYKNRQIEQKNNQIEIKNKQIEQLKICIKEEKKPSYNPKTKLLEQYTVILKEAVKNKSKWLPLLQKGIIDLNELNNTNLENAREILSKMINKIESHSFLKNRSRSKSLSHLKTILDSIDNQHIVNWQNYTKKLSDYEKEIQILKYEIQDLSDQVVTIKPHDQKANNELSISKNMNSFFLKNAKQISLSSPEPLPLSPRKNSSNS